MTRSPDALCTNVATSSQVPTFVQSDSEELPGGLSSGKEVSASESFVLSRPSACEAVIQAHGRLTEGVTGRERR